MIWLMSLLLAAVLHLPMQQDDPTPPPPVPVWVSPTPDADGVISVIVQPEESLWAIAARAGLSLPELLALNGLSESDIIRPGDSIIIGRVEAQPTAVPLEELQPTATRPPPTPRPTRRPPQATICLSAFADLNRNGVQDSGEPLRPGVAFSVYNSEAVVANYITDGVSEPHCLLPLPPGSYRVTRSVMPDEVLTTDGDWALQLGDANTLRQAFGSYTSAELTAADSGAVDSADVDAAGIAATGVASATTPTGPDATRAAVVAGADAEAADQSGSESNNSEVVGAVAPEAGPGFNWQLVGVIVLFGGGLLLLLAVLLLLARQARQKTGNGSGPPS